MCVHLPGCLSFGSLRSMTSRFRDTRLSKNGNIGNALNGLKIENAPK